MVENRNIGRIASWTNSKSCQLRMNDVQAMPTAAKASPISIVAGRASSAHHDSISPMTSITSRNAAE